MDRAARAQSDGVKRKARKPKPPTSSANVVVGRKSLNDADKLAHGVKVVGTLKAHSARFMR